MSLQRLIEAGAKRVFGIVTHGVFSGPALDRINKSDLEAVCATNTIPLHEKMALCPKIKVRSMVHLHCTHQYYNIDDCVFVHRKLTSAIFLGRQ